MKYIFPIIAVSFLIACSSVQFSQPLVPQVSETYLPSVEPIPQVIVKKACPDNMALVSGEYCSKPNHDLSQYDETGIGDPQCEVWKEKPCNLGGTHPSCMFARCEKYKETSSICLIDTIHKEFCMDKTEYTNPGDTLP